MRLQRKNEELRYELMKKEEQKRERDEKLISSLALAVNELTNERKAQTEKIQQLESRINSKVCPSGD